MTMQAKKNERYQPHHWLEIQRESFRKEMNSQRSRCFQHSGPNAGADGDQLLELSRSKSWACYPHSAFGEPWGDDDSLRHQTMQDRAGAGREEENFYSKWMNPRLSFPPLGLGPEYRKTETSSAGSSPARSGSSTPASRNHCGGASGVGANGFDVGAGFGAACGGGGFRGIGSGTSSGRSSCNGGGGGLRGGQWQTGERRGGFGSQGTPTAANKRVPEVQPSRGGRPAAKKLSSPAFRHLEPAVIAAAARATPLPGCTTMHNDVMTVFK
eukprot:TRINITY_DN20014_c0_g1_i1.p1 TRINITY_DN20014_c0_g1~~TRINITY_DN20014_c0_g1_i1.p1  ORF type:complete len:269 (-),score=50.04 TRINITY_DN20014_c0_g1_i1:98-904(-)